MRTATFSNGKKENSFFPLLLKKSHMMRWWCIFTSRFCSSSELISTLLVWLVLTTFLWAPCQFKHKEKSQTPYPERGRNAPFVSPGFVLASSFVSRRVSQWQSRKLQLLTSQILTCVQYGMNSNANTPHENRVGVHAFFSFQKANKYS